MKLHRFIAPDSQKAMLLVQQAMGPDALVYSMQRVPEGIEILAGDSINASDEEEVPVYDNTPLVRLMEKLNTKLQKIEETIQALSMTVNSTNETTVSPKRKKIKRKMRFHNAFTAMRKYLTTKKYRIQISNEQ